MNDYLSIVGNYHFWVLLIVYYALSNAVSALPLPTATSSPFYGWFFKFANGFAANISRATASKIPGVNGDTPKS